MKRIDSAHVIPLDDLITHEVTEDCVCGPIIKPVERRDGSIGWLISHNSLDNREKSERDNNG